MRLYEFIESSDQLIGLIKPILLRAKAEGVTAVSTAQLLNDIQDDSVTPELLVSTLNKHRQALKNVVSTANIDEILLQTGASPSMTSKYDQDVAKMKNTAVQQAKAGLE